MTKRRLIGIRRRGTGWRAEVRVDGTLHRRTFPLETPLEVIQGWRAKQQTRRSATRPGTLAHDVETYLATIRHLPGAQDRAIHLARWLQALGPTRSRYAITSVELSTIMSTWRTGSNGTKALAPVTVRHHRSTLLDLYRVLDPELPNPVQGTLRPRDPHPEARAVPLDQVWAILDRMRPDSKTRARLVLMLTTGLPHAQIMRLTPADWDQARQTLRVTGRRKGGGTKGRLLPLSPAAHEAMRVFDRVDAWGRFSRDAMRHGVLLMAKRHGLTPWTPYQLRHTYGTLLYQATGDLATVARLLGHSGTRTTERYTQEAWLEVDRAAQAAVSLRLQRQRKSRRSPPGSPQYGKKRRKS